MDRKQKLLELLEYLPQTVSGKVRALPEELLYSIEEIRLRLNRPLAVSGCGFEYFVTQEGEKTSLPSKAYHVNDKDIRQAVQLICNFSLYSVEEELRNGFITVSGGHRVGICGRAVLDNGKVRTLRDIAYLNYRIAKEIFGAADKVLGYVLGPGEDIFNTLIISPPQCGKTTLLRDLVRQLSNGIPKYGFPGKKLCLVDERSEIAACSNGVPRNDIGIRTDVLDSCPKAEGILMLVRAMAPEIIATDEIGKPEDSDAILCAVNAGVKVLTTIHGNDIGDFLRKKGLQGLQQGIFQRVVILSRKNGVGTLEAVLDHDYRDIYNNKSVCGDEICFTSL